MAAASRWARRRWTVAVLSLSLAAGGVFAAAALTSRGDDLRPAGGDIESLVRDRSAEVEQQRRTASRLEREIDELSRREVVGVPPELRERIAALQPITGTEAVSGPGVRVILDDAPPEVEVPEGDDPNILVVHEQDLQAVANALWAGGAEALTLQGRRLISTTGIKCVGSTVVLDGVPYAPPYEFEAVGDPVKLNLALSRSDLVGTYREYAERWKLVYRTETVPGLRAAPYDGAVALTHASAVSGGEG